MTRRAILVLGMHRSGTSALTGALVHAGCTPPRTLIPPADENPKGFWESAELGAFHDRLLRAGGSRWDDWSSFDLGTLDRHALNGYRTELAQLVAAEFGDAPLIVVKDPRMCRLVGLWRSVLDDIGVVAAATLALRDPLDVARSLSERDDIGSHHAVLLWLRHVLDAERDTRTLRRSLVRFEHLLSNWEAVASRLSRDLAIDWPTPADLQRPNVEAFLDPSLRHHVGTGDSRDLPPILAHWLETTVQAMSELERLPASEAASAQSKLDRVRDGVDEAWRTFRLVLVDLQKDEHEREEHAAHNSPARGPRTFGVARRLDELGARHAVLIGECQRVVHLVEVATAKQHAHPSLAIAFDGEPRALNQRLADVASCVEDLIQTGDAAQSERSATVARLSADIANLSERLETATGRVAALEESYTWRLTAPFRRAVALLHHRRRGVSNE